MGNKIILPWFSKDVSPNARVHWAKAHKAKQQHRELAKIYTRNANIDLQGRDKVHLSFTFYPPSRRRTDVDNCLAGCKAYIDGIADALDIDDSNFSMQIKMGEDQYNGTIEVCIG